MNAVRDKNGGPYRGGEGKTPVPTAFVQEVAEGEKKLLRFEPESKSDDYYK